MYIQRQLDILIAQYPQKRNVNPYNPEQMIDC
jgi:hypothetical protein